MTGWDIFTGRASLPPGTLAELADLRAALPGYDVIITSHSGQSRDPPAAARRRRTPGGDLAR